MWNLREDKFLGRNVFNQLQKQSPSCRSWRLGGCLGLWTRRLGQWRVPLEVTGSQTDYLIHPVAEAIQKTCHNHLSKLPTCYNPYF